MSSGNGSRPSAVVGSRTSSGVWGGRNVGEGRAHRTPVPIWDRCLAKWRLGTGAGTDRGTLSFAEPGHPNRETPHA